MIEKQNRKKIRPTPLNNGFHYNSFIYCHILTHVNSYRTHRKHTNSALRQNSWFNSIVVIYYNRLYIILQRQHKHTGNSTETLI